MTTVEDIRNIAMTAYEESVDAIYDEDDMFERRDVGWFIEHNLGRLYDVFGRMGYTDNDIMDAAGDIGCEPQDIDDAKEIVAAEMEDEFSYLMESWWDKRIDELTAEAKAAPAGKLRVYRVYEEAPTAEFTQYVGTDFDKAKYNAWNKYGYLTRHECEKESIILCYVDYPVEDVANLSDEELRDLICGECSECRVVKAVWDRGL
ncbi:MAG: hypothetical protein LUD72_13855 [Bacteroidales bacterium]|nr:hypothetical protein [Bacteroidales bacterium]